MRRLVMLAAAALALTACGGGADTESAAPEATATTAAATTTTAVNVAADKAKARALVFTRSDLPAGWKATPHHADPTDRKFEDQSAACLGRPSPTTYLTARANSPDFDKGDAEVSSEALLVRTVADFNADVDAFRGPKFLPCFKRLFTSSLKGQLARASVQSVAVAPLPVDSDAQLLAGFRATIKVLVQGQSVTLYVDAILLGKERIELTASFFDVQQPPDPALEKALVAKLGVKLDAV